MNLIPEGNKEGEPSQEAVLFIFYTPTRGGQFMFEYNNEPSQSVCLPEIGIDKEENPWFPVIDKIRETGIRPRQITALPDFIEPNSEGKDINYHPFLIQVWEDKFEKQMIPIWATYSDALTLPELGARDRKALTLAQDKLR
jgi:hypothetical protein